MKSLQTALSFGDGRPQNGLDLRKHREPERDPKLTDVMNEPSLLF